MKRILLFLFCVSISFAQSSGVGSNWTVITGTLQSAATANGNGSTLAVQGLPAALVTVNCSVACTGGTLITFQISQDGINWTAVAGQQSGTVTLSSTVLNQGTTPTVWLLNIAGAQLLRAVISAYSAGTVTVTATAIAASPGPNAVSIANTPAVTQSSGPWTSNLTSILGTAPTTAGFVDVKGADGNVFVRQATASNLNATVVGAGTAGTPSGGVVSVQGVSGGQPVSMAGHAGASVDAATGAAPPANALYIGGLKSGATGGFLGGVTVCDLDYVVNVSTATTVEVAAGVSGRLVHICAISLLAAAADNVAIIEGTGSTCTGGTTVGLTGGTTAASGYNFPANGGISQGTGFGELMASANTGNNVCIITSAATQLSGHIKYTIF